MTGRNDNLSFLDMLGIFAVVIQMADYKNDISQSSNDDLMNELQRQNKAYLEKIIENQNRILSILSKEDMSADKQQYYKLEGRLYIGIVCP